MTPHLDPATESVFEMHPGLRDAVRNGVPVTVQVDGWGPRVWVAGICTRTTTELCGVLGAALAKQGAM